MKTKVEIEGYEIEISFEEGMISVTAQKDDEVVEESLRTLINTSLDSFDIATENYTKEVKDLLEFTEDCSIDYGSQFFACKINITDNTETRNTEISFDGIKNFQWKTMTQREYSKLVFKNKTLLKCDAKKL